MRLYYRPWLTFGPGYQYISTKGAASYRIVDELCNIASSGGSCGCHYLYDKLFTGREIGGSLPRQVDALTRVCTRVCST